MNKNFLILLFGLWLSLASLVSASVTSNNENMLKNKIATIEEFLKIEDLQNIQNNEVSDKKIAHFKNTINGLEFTFDEIGNEWLDEYFTLSNDDTTLHKSDIIFHAAATIFIASQFGFLEEVRNLLGDYLEEVKLFELPSDTQKKTLDKAIGILKAEKIRQVLERSKNLNFDKKIIDDFLKQFNFKVYGQEEFICQEGDESREMFVIIEGTVGVYVGDKKVAAISAGNILGEMGFADNAPRSATLRAENTVEVASISYKWFEKILGKEKRYKKFLSMLLERLKNTEIGRSNNITIPSSSKKWQGRFDYENTQTFIQNEEIKVKGLAFIEEGSVSIYKNGRLLGIKEEGSIFLTNSFMKGNKEFKFFACSDSVSVKNISMKKVISKAEKNKNKTIYKDLLREVISLINVSNSLVMDNIKDILIYQNIFHENVVDEILKESEKVNIKGEDIICLEGEDSNELFIIEKGEIVVLVGGEEVARIGPGSVLGEIGFIDHAPRSATLKASRDTTIYSIPYKHLEEVFNNNPEAYLSLFYTITERFLNTTIGMDAHKGSRTFSEQEHQWYEPFSSVSVMIKDKDEEFEAENLYYIHEGEILVKKNGQILGKKKAGDIFGVDHLLKRPKSERSRYLAMKHCTQCGKLSPKEVKKKVRSSPALLKDLLREAIMLTERANSLVVSDFLQLLKPQNGALEDLGEIQEYERNEILCNQGDESDGIFLIQKGNIIVEVDDNEVKRFGRGKIIGEMGLAHKGFRSATLRASRKSRVLFIPYETIKTRLLDNPEILRHLIIESVQRVQSTRLNQDSHDAILINDHDNIEEREKFYNFIKKNFSEVDVSFEDISKDRKYIWFIENGEISLKKGEHVFGKIGAHQFFGLDRLFLDNADDTDFITASCENKITARKISKKKLLKALKRQGDFGWVIFQELSDLISNLNHCL